MTHRTLAVLVLSWLPIPAGDDPDPLKGTWQVVATVQDGKTLPESTLKDRTLTFDGASLTISTGSKTRKLTCLYDTSKDPATIDMALANGDGKPALGVYKLDGDTLKLCYGSAGDGRPDSFSSEVGSKRYLLTLKRQEKKEK